jgi:hypothetical protein
VYASDSDFLWGPAQVAQRAAEDSDLASMAAGENRTGLHLIRALSARYGAHFVVIERSLDWVFIHVGPFHGERLGLSILLKWYCILRRGVDETGERQATAHAEAAKTKKRAAAVGQGSPAILSRHLRVQHAVLLYRFFNIMTEFCLWNLQFSTGICVYIMLYYCTDIARNIMTEFCLWNLHFHRRCARSAWHRS